MEIICVPRGRIELPSDALQAPALPLSYRGPFYNPKTLRKFLNKVDGLVEGVGGGGVGSSIGFS